MGMGAVIFVVRCVYTFERDVYTHQKVSLESIHEESVFRV